MDATALTVTHTGVVQLSQFSKLPLAIFHKQPPCIFSLASSFNLGDEIHSSDRVTPPTHLLSSTFARAPSFLLLTARCTADVKAASRHLEAKSNVPVNNSTDDGKGRGVRGAGDLTQHFCMRATALLRCVVVQLSGFTPLTFSTGCCDTFS